MKLEKLADAFKAFADAVNEELTGVEVRTKELPLGLDPTGYRILTLVVQLDGCSAANVAHETKVPPLALRRVLMDLSAKGIAVRIGDRIVPTERGRALLRSTRATAAARERRTKGGLMAIRDGVQRIASAFGDRDSWSRGTADGPPSESV